MIGGILVGITIIGGEVVHAIVVGDPLHPFRRRGKPHFPQVFARIEIVVVDMIAGVGPCAQGDNPRIGIHEDAAALVLAASLLENAQIYIFSASELRFRDFARFRDYKNLFGYFFGVIESKPCLIVVGEKRFFLYNVDLRNYIRIRF